MYIFAIETSCDETAAAVVKDGKYEIASVVASSKELHEATGGVVPEIAARKQIEFIVPVIEQCLSKSKLSKEHIDAVAVTTGPGLIGSLLVGVEAAKALALAWDKPLIPVNHLVGHIYSNFIGIKDEIVFPILALVISGGHTDIVLMRGHGDLQYIGGTLDDAAGEAFDKTARLLGLAKYLGGAELSKLAATCSSNIVQGVLPRPMLANQDYDFSFSGLKTAVRNLVAKNIYAPEVIAREFETALTDVVCTKTVKAAKQYNCATILMGGGVAANKYLRDRLRNEAAVENISLRVPPIELCGDNAVYIASAAFFNQHFTNFENIQANPSLGIMDIA